MPAARLDEGMCRTVYLSAVGNLPVPVRVTYTFKEGTTLEGMTQKAMKVGDGTAWTPTITVKGGTSGFYSIGVQK